MQAKGFAEEFVANGAGRVQGYWRPGFNEG